MNTQGETPNNNNNAQLVRDLNDLSIVTSKLPLFPLAPPETEDESLKTETEGFVEPYVIPGVDDENTHWLQPKSYRAFLKTSPFKFINTILADEINKVRTKMSGGSTPEFEYLRLWMQQRPVNFPWGIASDKVVLQSAQSNAHNIPYAICLTGDAEAFLEPFILRTLFHRLIFGLGGTPVIFLHNHYSSFVNLEELKELATMLGVTVLSSEPNVAEDEPGWENTCQKFPKSNNKDFNTLRGRQKCFNLIERYERLNGYRFHYIIQSQINLVWLTPMKSLKTFGPESIHMSNGGSRVSEHFAILPRHYASNFFSAFNMYLKCDDSYDPINIPYSNSLNHLLLHTIARSNRPPQRHTSIAHASWDPQNGIDCAAVSANTISLNLCLQVVKKMKGE